jgi:hypothetical protein
MQHLRAHRVAGFEHGVDVALADRPLALAQQVQQVFLQVREGGHVGAAQHAGAALDGVHGAEDRVQVVGQRRIGVQPQQDRFDVGQVLLRFLEENFPERVGIAEGAG